ncbi:MAG TPA: MFS transporter [Candidatus Dormibacteraeota bacterium]|nr:MFS transporter [Candidatus Dormibacteraeota bacterium]
MSQVVEPGEAAPTGWRGRLAALSLGPNFDHLWAGSAVSQFGSAVGVLALSLTGVLTLHASAVQMGLLSTIARLPWLTYPIAGVYVDRLRRRPVMIAADVLRAGLIALVPIAAVLGLLRMEVLYAVAFLGMTLGVWFDTASSAFVPATVETGRLAAANSRLGATGSAARIAGPSVGGLVVQAISGPFAMLVDAASFLFSALMIGRVRLVRPETPPPRGSFLADLSEGFRYLWGQPVLRALSLTGAITQFAGAGLLAINLLYLTRELHVPAAAVGLAVSGTAPGTLVGSLVATRVVARIGQAATLVGGWAVFGAAALLIPLAPGDAPAVAVVMVVVAGFLMGAAGQTSGIVGTTLVQSIPPPHLLGRVFAGLGFISLGVAPLGALAGGVLGGVLSLRAVMLVAALLMLTVPLLGLLTVVPHLPRQSSSGGASSASSG